MLCEAKSTYLPLGRSNQYCLLYPNRTLKNKLYSSTPYFLLTERKPTVKYFHVFGSKCLKDSTKIKVKFDSKAQEGIFMGYGIERRTYMCL